MPHFARKPLVAGRIYCKEEIMRQEREKGDGAPNRMKRMPIQNLMNIRR